MVGCPFIDFLRGIRKRTAQLGVLQRAWRLFGDAQAHHVAFLCAGCILRGHCVRALIGIDPGRGGGFCLVYPNQVWFLPILFYGSSMVLRLFYMVLLPGFGIINFTKHVSRTKSQWVLVAGTHGWYPWDAFVLDPKVPWTLAETPVIFVLIWGVQQH